MIEALACSVSLRPTASSSRCVCMFSRASFRWTLAYRTSLRRLPGLRELMRCPDGRFSSMSPKIDLFIGLVREKEIRRDGKIRIPVVQESSGNTTRIQAEGLKEGDAVLSYKPLKNGMAVVPRFRAIFIS